VVHHQLYGSVKREQQYRLYVAVPGARASTFPITSWRWWPDAIRMS